MTKKNNCEIKRISDFVNLRNFNKLLLVCIIIVGVYFLTSTNDLTVKGFELQKLKLESMQLQSERETYLQKKITLESYLNLNKKISSLGMVSADNIEYISVSSGLVAKK